MTAKKASTEYPIHPLISERWSPYGFSERPVTAADLRSLFEAARWAPSSFNEQPWSFIVATRDDPSGHEKLLSCLMTGNQGWARSAPVLALGVISLKFSRTGKENRSAHHDLGLAAGNLSLEATERGLSVHQMAGILPEKARELYGIPGEFEAWTGLAIGYRADPADVPDSLKERDVAPRQRKPIDAFVFGETWGRPASIVEKKDG